MIRRSNPTEPFRMRIRDLVRDREVAQSMDDKPEYVVKRIAATWVVRTLKRLDEVPEWTIEVWSRKDHVWRPLTENETQIVRLVIDSKFAESGEEVQPLKGGEEMPTAAPRKNEPVMSEEDLLTAYRKAYWRLNETQTVIAGEENPSAELRAQLRNRQNDVENIVAILGFTPEA